jgi:hypothetical protein
MKSAKDLEMALSDGQLSDIDGYMLAKEMEAVKSLIPPSRTQPMGILRHLVKVNESDDFPNLCIALRILYEFLNVKTPSASGGLRLPDPLTRGFVPGPYWGQAPRPSYRLALRVRHDWSTPAQGPALGKAGSEHQSKYEADNKQKTEMKKPDTNQRSIAIFATSTASSPVVSAVYTVTVVERCSLILS